MHRTLTVIGLALLLGSAANQAVAQGKSKAQKIANALSAAPRAVSKDAAVMDWPASEGAQITPVTTTAGLDDWLHVAAICGWIETPEELAVRRRVYGSLLFDGAWRRWIATRDGTPVSAAVRAALIDAARRKAAASIRAEAEALAADEADRAEAAQVLRDMETLRAW